MTIMSTTSDDNKDQDYDYDFDNSNDNGDYDDDGDGYHVVFTWRTKRNIVELQARWVVSLW